VSGEWGGEQQEQGPQASQGPQTGQKLSKADKRRARRSKRGEDREPEPPAVPSEEDSRAQRVLYVACEGKRTEPDYLTYLNRRFGGSVKRRFQIQPVCNDRSGLKPVKAVAAVRKWAAEDETWALIDRDEHFDIPQAYQDAAADGTELCFSHPSFDLWLLLHFQAFSGSQSGSSDIVHDKLRQAHPAFKRFDKGDGKGLNDDQCAALSDDNGEITAIENARSLVGQCTMGNCHASQRKLRSVDERPPRKSSAAWAARSGHSADCPVLSRDPSTDVWRLLVSLGIGKDHY
jgi:hypothetical protein